MKNIRLFQTIEEYTSEVDNLEYPTVSYIEESDEVNYTPNTPSEITFQIDGCEYTALSNMTWGEWVNYEDQDANCVLNGCDNYWHITSNGYVYGQLSAEGFCVMIGDGFVTKNDVRVNENDIIENGFVYGCEKIKNPMYE